MYADATHPFEVVAMGYSYPRPGAADDLARAVEAHLAGGVGGHMRSFVQEVAALSLAEWEELHTSTLDLTPTVIPYVGHHAWGDNYRRGELMAILNETMRNHGVELDGELPDHIAPLLRYLAVADEPVPELSEILKPAVDEMISSLAKAQPTSPYRHLLSATLDAIADLRPLVIGTRR